MPERYKTARCILYREDRFLLAVHNSFWRESDRRWGLPGGQIEWRDPPHIAAIRELHEELGVQASDLMEIGPFSYKHSMHMVYAAHFGGEIGAYDDTELIEIRWFDESGITALAADKRLHAGYELEAIRTLRRMLRGNDPAPERLASLP